MPIQISLSLWDNASTQQREQWLAEGVTLSCRDGEILAERIARSTRFIDRKLHEQVCDWNEPSALVLNR